MSAILEYLENTFSMLELPDGFRYSEIRPRLICADGFSMSVQGSRTHYCSPRVDGWLYSRVEVGYPSEKAEELMPYAECPDEDPTGTVYGYVPIEIVDAVISKHGGILADALEMETALVRAWRIR